MTLSTTYVWVLFPLIIAVITAVFYQRKLLSILLTSLSAFALAAFATFFPEDMTLSIGPLTLEFKESLNILGRQISVLYDMLPFIALIYAVTGLWDLSSGITGVPGIFRPTSLAMTALLTAALGVQPFLYAALLIETTILVSIPTLSPPGQKTSPGILRYLTLQTLAMPFILLAGWLLTGVETLPADSPLVGQTMFLLGLGIAIWLAVFPFHSWVPMLSQKTSPLVMSFLLTLMPMTILVFALNFINRFTFLRELESLFSSLRVMGVIMIVINGAWLAVQTDIKRALGFSALSETGFALLAMGLYDQGGLTLMMLLFPVRALAFWLWGYILTNIEQHSDSLELHALQGFARRFPALSSGLLLAQFSLAGLPLLASFPIKIALFTGAFEVGTALGIITFFGNLGLILLTLRLLSFLVTPRDAALPNRWTFSEKTSEYIPIMIVVLMLIIMGLFPNTFFANIIKTLTVFSQLQ
jgi:formate hydrogenlyase subunit 3/multisubunit Na+/H+ antiporter MnhD subunit